MVGQSSSTSGSGPTWSASVALTNRLGFGYMLRFNITCSDFRVEGSRERAVFVSLCAQDFL